MTTPRLLLGEMRQRWTDRPSRPPDWWHLPLPPWAQDELEAFGHGRVALPLWQRGEIRWGWMLMAHVDIYAPGEKDRAAGVLWSPDPLLQDDPGLLQATCAAYWVVKSGGFSDGQPLTEVPGLKGFVAHSRDEYTRRGRIRLPPMIAGARIIYDETLMLQRAHLPQGHLTGKLVPLVVDPSAQVRAVRLLPCQIWPTPLVEMWSAG